MKIGEKINQLRTQHGYTMQVLADKSGLTKGYISLLEKGINPGTGKEIIPSLETVQNIAYAFNLSLDNFLDGVESYVELPLLSSDNSTLDQIISVSNQLTPPRQHNVLNYAENQLDEQNGIVKLSGYIKEDIPEYTTSGLYGALSAGTGQQIFDNPIEEVEIPTSIIPSEPYDIMLKIVGDSMQPAFKDGEYVFIKLTKDIRSGQFAAIIVDGEAYLKKVYIDEDCLRLVSLNKGYDDIIVDDISNVEIVGTVVL